MNRKIRLGIVGAGSIAKHHLDVIKAIDWLALAGITSRTRSKAQALAQAYQIDICSDDLKGLMAQARPDALLLTVSADQMFIVAKAAMEYRVPLFIEKPAGLCLEENEQLAELARSRSIRNMVGFNRRFYSIFHQGLELVNKYKPFAGVAVEGHERMWRVRGCNEFSERVLDNWIYANSVHTIDLLRFFGGEVINVSSLALRFKECRGDQFAALVEFVGGRIGQYNAHWYSPGGWKVVLYANGATAEFKPLEKGLWVDRDFKSHEFMPDEVDIKYKPGFYRQMEAFGRLAGGEKLPGYAVDLAESCKTMDLARRLTLNLKEIG